MYSAHTLRALAVAAHCDPRTATRFLAGLPVAAMTRARLEQAALSLGITKTTTDAGARPVAAAITAKAMPRD